MSAERTASKPKQGFEFAAHKRVGEGILERLRPIKLDDVIKKEGNKMGDLGLYIHIPFCTEICTFCAFHRQVGDEQRRETYVEVLEEHISETLSKFGKDQPIRSIYIGGGTPSLLSLNQIESVLETVKSNNDASRASISFELHPENVSKTYIRGLQALGINRFSVGVQNLSAIEREVLGRTLTTGAVDLERLQILNELGVQYNLDLMYGTPNQTSVSLMSTVFQIVDEVRPPEVTLYQYVNAYGSDTRKRIASGELERPSLRSRHKMYNDANKYLKERGYHQTGTLSFARDEKTPERRLLSNGTNFVGLGPRTYSKIGSTFFINDIRTYNYTPGRQTADYYGIDLPKWSAEAVKIAFSIISRQRHHENDGLFSSLKSWQAEAITQTYGVLYYVLNQPQLSRRQQTT